MSSISRWLNRLGLHRYTDVKNAPPVSQTVIVGSQSDDVEMVRIQDTFDDSQEYIVIPRSHTPRKMDMLVTLWPSMPHFHRFTQDKRLAGIRLNSAMTHLYDLDAEIATAMKVQAQTGTVPLWFDLKGRQLRVTDATIHPDHLEIVINHPIEVQTPVPVLFKAGEDVGLLTEVKDKTRLIFDGGPQYNVQAGESIHIRHPSLRVNGPTFTDTEKERIAKVVRGGFTRFFLSYVERQEDVDSFREFVGDAPVILKIENKAGLNFVENRWRKQDNEWLMAARGDLYVEVDKPHDILRAMRMIVRKDPEAYAGSRMLLSMVKKPVPEMADLSDLAWMYEIGYRRLMLCDELCLKEELLVPAVNAFDAFRRTYAT
jgi:pyruvate kinase